MVAAIPEKKGVHIELRKDAQSDFVASTERYPALFAGRRFGKSVANVVKTVKYCKDNPGARGMLTIPEWSDWDKTINPTLHDLLGEAKGSIWTFEEKKRILHFPAWGCQVFVRPALEAESLRGPTLAFASMDEVGSQNQYPAFRILSAAVSMPGYPLQLWLTSTPSVDRPWLMQLYKQGINPETGEPLRNPKEFRIYQGETRQNYYLSEDYIQSQYDLWEGTRWGRQELYGDFLTVSGLAFPDFTEKTHVKYPPADEKITNVFCGMDFGTSSPTAIYIIKQDESKRLWVTDEYYHRNATEEHWGTWLAEHGVRRVNCDPSISNDQAAWYSRKLGINFVPAMKMRKFTDRFQFWGGVLSNGEHGPKLFISPSCVNLIDELNNLAFAQSRHGYEKDVQWAPSCAEHGYDAVAYGAGAAQTFKVRPIEFVRYLN